MPQPTNYTPTTDFSQQEANNASGRSTVNTAALDAEFANIETTLDQTLSNLQLIQRDDGKLKDLVCEVATLSPEVLNLIGNFRIPGNGTWQPFTPYAVNDLASDVNSNYVCIVAHTSGAAFDSTKWTRFGFTAGTDIAAFLAQAEAAALNAEASKTNAASSASTASSAASSASSSASAASSSASSASSAAYSASASATSAANSAADAVSYSSKIQSISASVSGNALTISAGSLSLDFRSTTLGSGTVTTVKGTPANLVISSGSTLGTSSGVTSRIAVLAINNAGTIELAAVNLSGGNKLDETNLISTTAEGGAGAADSASVIYSTTARTSVPYRVVGFVESTQATAGTWVTSPSQIHGAGGLALAEMNSLGYGQTWQNVTGSRAVGTTYYNTTGKPILLFISGNSTAFSTLTINGVAFPFTTNSSSVGCITAIVPNGASYVVTNLSISTNWNELR